MIDNSQFEENGYFHFFNCPKCGEVIKCKTADNLDVLVRIHEFDHNQQERAKGKTTQYPLVATMIKDLTSDDIDMLKAMGIKA